MSIELLLYLADRCGDLQVALAIASILSIVGASFGGFICAMEGLSENYKRFMKNKWWIIIVFCFLWALIPKQKTIYMIMGAHYLKESELPSKVEMAINKKLNEYLDYNEEEKDQ